MTSEIFLLLWFVFSIHALEAQNLELGFGFGSGSAFIYEDADVGIDINYSTPLSSIVDLTYSQSDKYFDAKIRLQYINVGIEGNNWKGLNEEIDGDVSTFSTMVLLEHLKRDKNWNVGYNFGLGYTNQSFRPDLERSLKQIKSTYLSLHIGGILSKRINDNFNLRFEPCAFWTDPINSLRESDKWQIAGEDLSILAQIGLVYKIK